MLVILCSIVALVLGYILGRMLRPKKVEIFDGTLELFERDDSLYVGVSIDTAPEILRSRETAKFKTMLIA